MRPYKQKSMESKSPAPNKAVDCVGVICFRGEDVLLIQRGKAPRKGDWSIPGGRIEKGETEEEAAIRELMEETSISATLGPKVATIPALFEGFNYMLHDYVAEWHSGEPKAGDDAAKAVFMPPHKLDALGMWPKTREVIETAREALKTASLNSDIAKPDISG
jgi:8-oxo-dGTP diphosphatase